MAIQLTFTPSIKVQQTIEMGIAAWTVKFDPWITIRQINSLTVKFQIQVPAQQRIITILSSRCSSPMRKQRGATKNNRIRGFLQTKELHASIITTK